MNSLVSQEPSLASIPESPSEESYRPLRYSTLSRNGKSSTLTRDSKKFNSLRRDGRMPHYMMGDNSSQKSHSSGGGGGGYPMPQLNDPGGGYHAASNGHHSDGASPGSSQLSMEGRGESTLITRTQKQHVTQNVTTTTRTIKEVTYLGPDGQPIDYLPSHMPPMLHYDHNDYQNQHFGEYQHYGDYGRPPTPPTPSERSTSPLPDRRQPDYLRGQQQAGGYPPLRSGYDELDTTLMPPRGGLPLPDQYRNSPSPGVGGHPGYSAGYHQHSSTSSSPPHSTQQQQQQPFLPPRSSVSSLTGSQQQQHYHPYNTSPQQQYRPLHPYDDDEDIYGQQQHNNNYSNFDPHNNNHLHQLNHTLDNSVFEDNNSTDGGGGGGFPDYPGALSHQQLATSREAPRAVFDEDDQEPRPAGARGHHGNHHAPGMSSMPGVQWRDPDLHEVIEFLSNPNSVIKANAAAYLQHLCYMDDPVKAKTRQLGGIPPLVALLSHEIPDIHKNACGALRNLSYGRQNDENKRAIKAAGGTNALVRLLRKTADNDVKELVTGVLWNLSSCDDLKRTIIDEALLVIVNIVIIPHSGWDRGAGQGGDTHWSTVFRNASGILRNVSSAGDYGRKKLRECEGLVDALLYLVRNAIERANIDNKSVENAVCVLRNLSYRAQEVEDPNYDKRQLPVGETRAAAGKQAGDSPSGGCFGASKAKPNKAAAPAGSSGSSQSGGRSGGGPAVGMELLWQPEVVQPYLNLLSNCSNPETLEAAAGAIQNLSACYWQPSIDIRAAVRKEKGLPILVELLRMEVDRVVCAVATALRNLAIDQRNKELIGKYAMRDLVQKLPSGNPQRDVATSDDTIAAVLATLNEVIKKHPEFSRSLLEAGGVDRLMNITRQRSKYTSRVVKFASQVLFSMWQHQELREVYRKSGWKETDFVTKTVAARNARPNSPTHLNSTLNRPMASQGGTRYEDRTMARPHNNGALQQPQYHAENIPLENMSLYGGGSSRIYPPGQHMVRAGEPVYAQVNRDRKRSKGDPIGGGQGAPDHLDYSDRHWAVQQQQPSPQQAVPPAGDSWV